MTREEAANILDLKTRPEALDDFVGPELAGIVHQAMIMGAEALRSRWVKPSDRCGCGGKAILTDYTVEGAAKQYSVACETCFMGLPYGFDTPDDAWAAWRRAMGTPSGAIGPETGEMAPNGE